MEDTDNYVERLRAVFDLCDSEKKGYITVAHFVDLALEHFEADSKEVCIPCLLIAHLSSGKMSQPVLESVYNGIMLIVRNCQF